MANITGVHVYMINQNAPIPLASVTKRGFPTTFGGFMAGDCSTDVTTRSLSTGVNVYSYIQDPQGNKYYSSLSFDALVTLFG